MSNIIQLIKNVSRAILNSYSKAICGLALLSHMNYIQRYEKLGQLQLSEACGKLGEREMNLFKKMVEEEEVTCSNQQGWVVAHASQDEMG